ncbi:hypothetical protein QTH90_11710 [Variovorax sp. J2P1-59]|uniref:hypothetical protein n=1 Tax=Variovorax flavidus TaxID=3053501 RepID=UPI002576ECE7|nr:hypothetical protein [Variovorax sp. J2P1-59]MDM0075053.1 hypothetical protein [Variovorax sp. J2P1-59]
MFTRLWPLVVVLAATTLAGCAGEPTWLPLGTDRATTLQRLGTPTSTYPLPGGGERLQYSRAPAGFAVNNVDVDASGKVFSIRQELYDGLFDSTIKPGEWRVEDVLRTYGRPFEISRVTSFDGDVWAWHYKSLNNRRLLYIYVDPTGVVDHYHTADELFRDMDSSR